MSILNKTIFAYVQIVHTTPEKFENAASFLRLGLPFTRILHENGVFLENALQTEEIWKRRLFVFVWTGNALETEVFENEDVTFR